MEVIAAACRLSFVSEVVEVVARLCCVCCVRSLDSPCQLSGLRLCRPSLMVIWDDIKK
jgi:hypothetical protein